MKKAVALIFCFLVLAYVSIAQNQDYFQQDIKYTINVELDDIEKSLKGDIEIVYKNNSTDSLDYVFFHIYPNAYKNNSTAFAKQQLQLRQKKFFFTEEKYRGFIDSLDFYTNGIKSDFIVDESNIDIGKLILSEPLLPGDEIFIYTPFYVKLPKAISRMGFTDVDDFYLTHWYPKPAVYDKNKWNAMPYLDMGEFHSEFGQYIVNITLPNEYIVAANGNLISRSELHRLEDYALKSDDKRKKIFNYPEHVGGKKTLSYIQDGLIDFAWFAGKDFIVKLGIVVLPESKRSVRVWAYYHPENQSLWEDAISYAKQSILLFSELIGEYPFDECVVVDGSRLCGGGMEYPGIVLASGYDKMSLESIITHEIAHIWFYGILANNERSEGWIDEGFASYYEMRYCNKYQNTTNLAEEFYGKDIKIGGLHRFHKEYFRELIWNFLKRKNISQPPNTESHLLSPANYYIMLYKKTPLAIQTLEKYIGQDTFDEMIKEFYDKNKFTHISSKKLRSHFEEYLGEDLSWFFDDFINKDLRHDYKIRKYGMDSVKVTNVGEAICPLFISIGDSLIRSEGFAKSKIYPHYNNNVIIDKQFYSIDLNRRNNAFYYKSIDKVKSCKLRFFNLIDIPNEKHLSFIPILGFNNSDGMLPGLLLYNSFLPGKNFEYQLVPMYGIRSRRFSGMLNVSKYFVPNSGVIRQIEIFFQVKSFSVEPIEMNHYYKIDVGANILFNTDLTSFIKSELQLRNIFSSCFLFEKLRDYQQLRYIYEDNKILNPYFYSISIERSMGYLKSWFETKYSITYNEKKRSLDFRFFAGTFLYSRDEYYGDYNFRISGQRGTQDYLYDYLFIDRSADIGNSAGYLPAHQFVRNNGAFTIYTPWGQTDKWMLSLNITTSLPMPMIRLYSNFALLANNNDYFKLGNAFYEAGVELEIFRNIASVYFPLIVSRNIWDTSNQFYTDNYLQKVRFTLYLEKINPFKYRDKVYLLY